MLILDLKPDGLLRYIGFGKGDALLHLETCPVNSLCDLTGAAAQGCQLEHVPWEQRGDYALLWFLARYHRKCVPTSLVACLANTVGALET